MALPLSWEGPHGQVKLVSRWRDHLNAMFLRSGPGLIQIWWSLLRRKIRQILNGFPGLGKVLLMNAARSLQDEHSRWLCTCVLERMWHTTWDIDHLPWSTFKGLIPYSEGIPALQDNEGLIL